MKIAQIAVSTNTGLGVQGKSFYDHIHPDHVMVVDISEVNGAKQHPGWYPDAYHAKGLMLDDDIRKFIDSRDIDIIFVTESAYSFYLYSYANYRGIPVISQPNWEFFDWQVNPQLPRPDAFISPSLWHYDDLKAFCDENKLPCICLHCPVDREQFPFRSIRQARTFIHNIGKPAIHDRNGTHTVIEASKYIKSDVKIKIHFQGEQNLIHQRSDSVQDYYDYAEKHGNLDKLILETVEYDNPADSYKEGDVMILPRRYGGNCLVLNEALSCGMPVLMTDISPNNQFLPERWLVPAYKKSSFTPRTAIDIYEADPRSLAAKIDEFATMDETQMLRENRQADVIAENICWDIMLPKYLQFFEEVLSK